MTSSRRPAALVTAGLISLGLAVAACGASADDAAPAATDAPLPVATDAPLPVATDAVVEPAAAADVPSALQFSAPLVGGDALDAASLAGKPTVFWFWAPT
ncbi:MAG: hypothetical protein HKN44_15090 [Ilumatobacter sp.]|nr:hypothetical protein [Ilumatobacter sp.]